MPMSPRLLRPIARFVAPGPTTVQAVVEGFTGAFDPANWELSPLTPSNGNSVTFNGEATTLTLVKSLSNATVASALIGMSSVLDAIKPAGAGAPLGWSVSFDYAWSTATLNSRFDFNANDGLSLYTLNTSAPASGSFAVQYPPEEGPYDGQIQFRVQKLSGTTGTGTGVISNFLFVAEYEA